MLVKVLVVLLSLHSVFGCEQGWYRIGSKCVYPAVGWDGTFSDADSYCGRIGSRIATVYSQNEQNLFERMLNENGIDKPIWLGGHRENMIFAWRNDHIAIVGDVFSNWAPGAPSRNFPKACLQMNSDGKWEDNFCFIRNAIVCERPEQMNNEITTSRRPITTTSRRPTTTTSRRPTTTTSRPMTSTEPTTADPDQHHCESRTICELERRVIQIQRQLNERIDAIIRQQDRKWNDWEHESREVLMEINRNFTGVAMVFNSINQQLDSIDFPDINLDEIKEELKEFILLQTNFERPTTSAITDARLAIVNYRRALQIQKNGSWITLGYV